MIARKLTKTDDSHPRRSPKQHSSATICRNHKGFSLCHWHYDSPSQKISVCNQMKKNAPKHHTIVTKRPEGSRELKIVFGPKKMQSSLQGNDENKITSKIQKEMIFLFSQHQKPDSKLVSQAKSKRKMAH